MSIWPRHPVIYEINTWVWLHELSQKYQMPVNFATVPEREWDAIASYGFDAVWFMGVWQRSPEGIEISMQNQGLLENFRRALPDFSAEDNVGSPYCVRRYIVDEHLGGPEGLASARGMLRKRGVRLVLDFVPNHVAPDHPWVDDCPEYFVQGNTDDVGSDQSSFVAVGGRVFALGRDPYFPAWPDVLQLNAFHPGLRLAVIGTILAIAEQCDGIRCDMAMLMLNRVFERTWGARAGGPKPIEDYWKMVIPAIKTKWPEFKFIAEAYWDLEWELQQQGFDYCYDKKLYDRMEHEDAESVRLHLLADSSYQERMVRFIENHDEPRAAAAFPDGKGRAAIAILTLPGAKLLHEGQLEGRKVRLPVFLSRRPQEPVDEVLAILYRNILNVINQDVFRNGQWSLCERSGWHDNQSCRNILSWCWAKDEQHYLVVVNFSEVTSQALVHLPWDELRGMTWCLNDALSEEVYDRSGDEMRNSGLYVDLKPWQWHLFQMQAL